MMTNPSCAFVSGVNSAINTTGTIQIKISTKVKFCTIAILFIISLSPLFSLFAVNILNKNENTRGISEQNEENNHERDFVQNANSDDINIISPENRIYTAPMSGYYPATYTFENDVVGGDPTGWSVSEPGGSTVNVIAEKEGHSKVVEIYNAPHYGSGIPILSVPDLVTGTVEFWILNPDTSHRRLFMIRDGPTNIHVFMAFWEDGSIRVYTDGYQTVSATYAANQWQHVKIEWDCTTDWHLWIDGDSQDDGSGFGWFQASRPPTTMDRLYFKAYDYGQTFYFDDFGCSWDPNYELGDNTREGLLLDFETDIDLVWMGYSLDEQATKTILGDTVIPFPYGGPHTIQVFGEDSLGTVYESDIRSFTTEETEDYTSPIIEINYIGGDYTDANQGKWNIFAYDEESGINEDTIRILIDGNYVGDVLGDYEVPNTLGEHIIYVEVENNDPNNPLLGADSDSIIIVDDDISPPVISYIYTGDGTDGNPGEIIVSASDESRLSVDPSGTYTVSNSLGIHEFIFSATDTDNDRVGDSATTTIAVSINIIDDDISSPVLSNFIITDDIQEVHVSFTAIDDSGDDDQGISLIKVYIDDELTITHIPMVTETVFEFNIPNDWILELGTHLVKIEVWDADNDRINDSLSTITTGTFEITLEDVKQFVLWEIDQLIDNVDLSSEDCWRNPELNRKVTMVEKLAELEVLVSNDELSDAYDKLLHDIKPKLTGLKTDENEDPWGNGVFNNPWVICEDLQEKFRIDSNDILSHIRLIIENT